MTIGSLFSGIGGLELGLEWAGLGPTLWQVEKDEKLRNCLGAHWPKAERFGDIHFVGFGQLQTVDIICGGFPCQDISAAGKRRGLSGHRSGLWREFLRVVKELRPTWVVVENVASNATAWVDHIRNALERIGYSSFPVPLAASDLGAWHQRRRIFIVAHSTSERLERRIPTKESRADQPESARHSGWSTEPGMGRVADGLPGRVDKLRALGNAVVPQCAEVIGWIIRELDNTNPTRRAGRNEG